METYFNPYFRDTSEAFSMVANTVDKLSEGVSAFGAFAPFDGEVDGDRFFIKACFLFPDGTESGYGKLYTYCISPDCRPPQRGDKIWVSKSCITRRSPCSYIITNGTIKEKPYKTSVLKVVDVIVANIKDELPDELEYINDANSWVTIVDYIKTDKNEYQEENFMANDFMNGLTGMCGPIGSGQCKITMDGNIAVKTPSGYKTYNAVQNALINCDSFVFGGFDEMFFVIPTNNVQKGDIILSQGKPKYVIDAKENMITVVNYDSGNVENMLPERHMFMGNTYFYGKIVSMFGNTDSLTGGEGINKIMKFQLMSQMMKGMGGKNSEGMNPMMMMMMMNGGMGNMFDNIFGAVNPVTPTPVAPVAPVAPTVTPGVGVVPTVSATDVKEDK